MDDPSGSAAPTGPAEMDGRMPTWVKVFIAVAAIAMLLFLALHLAGLGPTVHQP